jgi:hypothetical protein
MHVTVLESGLKLSFTAKVAVRFRARQPRNIMSPNMQFNCGAQKGIVEAGDLVVSFFREASERPKYN